MGPYNHNQRQVRVDTCRDSGVIGALVAWQEVVAHMGMGKNEIPGESTFSRAFPGFSDRKLAERVYEAQNL